MHLHGHNFYVLHEGPGEWDGTIIRPENPQRRDVQLVRGGGHMVMQFDGHPGVWAFHCHIAWHAAGGFFASFVVDPEAIQRDLRIPPKAEQTCRDYRAWLDENSGVYEVDSLGAKARR